MKVTLVATATLILLGRHLAHCMTARGKRSTHHVRMPLSHDMKASQKVGSAQTMTVQKRRSIKRGKGKGKDSSDTPPPTLAPSTSRPSVAPTLAPLVEADVLEPLCVDTSGENVTFFSGNASDARPSEVDVNDNGILDPEDDLNDNGILDVDSGISMVSLLADANNLQISVEPFNTGDPSVVFSATRIDDLQPANGTIVISDEAGNSCFLNVTLDPFDQELFDSLFGFPAAAHEAAFGESSAFEVPTYDITDLSEEIGVFTGSNEDGIPLTLNVTEVLVTSEDLSNDLLNDTETEADVLAFVQDESYTSFVLRGLLVGPNATVEVVALAFTTASLSPNASLVVIYDPLNPDDGITDFSNPPDERRNLLEVSPGRHSSPLLQPHAVSDTLPALINWRQGRRRRLQGCSSGLNEIQCPPKTTKSVNSACVSAATTAFQLAVDAAQGKFDTAIAIAKAIYDARIIALNVKKVRDFAKQLIPCVLIGFLSGPLGYAACAARALAICIAKQAAPRLAARAAFELAKRNAELVLEAAIATACATLRATVRACVECKSEPCQMDSDCNSEEYPDPHFRTWNGEQYDFHGACDMIHVRNDLLELQIRTERRGGWSAVSRAALRIGDDTLEVLLGGTFLVNGVEPATPPAFLGEVYPFEVTPRSVIVRLSGGQFVEFRFYVSNILIRIDAHGSDFFESGGMAGTWNMFGLVGRDRNATFTDTTMFAAEWEVNQTLNDPILFTTPAESACIDPPEVFVPDPDLVELAEEACADLLEGQPERENCIFDVLATNGDETWAENPAYTEPLMSTARCAASNSTTPSCADLGGECVFRCNSEERNCLDGDGLCVANANLAVVDENRRGRRLQFVEGCSCALPLTPTSTPTFATTSAPSMKRGGKGGKRKDKKKKEKMRKKSKGKNKNDKESDDTR